MHIRHLLCLHMQEGLVAKQLLNRKQHPGLNDTASKSITQPDSKTSAWLPSGVVTGPKFNGNKLDELARKVARRKLKRRSSQRQLNLLTLSHSITSSSKRRKTLAETRIESLPSCTILPQLGCKDTQPTLTALKKLRKPLSAIWDHKRSPPIFTLTTPRR